MTEEGRLGKDTDYILAVEVEDTDYSHDVGEDHQEDRLEDHIDYIPEEDRRQEGHIDYILEEEDIPGEEVDVRRIRNPGFDPNPTLLRIN